jgi:hypothetical protein
VRAQSPDQQEDREAAMVMRDIMEYVLDKAEYDKVFLYAVIAALVNPASFMHIEYSKQYRTIKEVNESGGWTTKEVEDDDRSGLRLQTVPVDELLIGNIYEHDMQNQPFLIWRRAIDYYEAYQKYAKEYPNFKKYVRAGKQILVGDNSNAFYEQEDENLSGRLVELIIYYNKLADLQLIFCNGVLLNDPDCPNPRQDKAYPFVKGGYELFDEGKFFYYSSLVKKMAKDEETLNEIYRLIINAARLQTEPPINIFGEELVSSSMITPGAINVMKGETRAEPMTLGVNVNPAIALKEIIEKSMSESSSDILQSGQAMKATQTAFEISRLEANAKIMLGMFGKMIGFMVKELGELVINDILQFITVADVANISGEDVALKYKTFLLSDETSGKSKRIEFSSDMPEEITQDELRMRQYQLYDKAGGRKATTEVTIVNPAIFRSCKFKIVIAPDFISPPSEALRKALNLELYDRAIQHPLANKEALLRDVLYNSYDMTRKDPEKFIMKQQPVLPPQPAAELGAPPSVLSKVFSQGRAREMEA